MSGLTQALVINAIVLFATLEADLGPHRKVNWFRIARPLVVGATIIPLFIQTPATAGTGLVLEVAGAATGILLGLLASSVLRVYRSPRTGRPVTRAGVAYAALWIVVIGARTAFSYGSAHWFSHPLATWMIAHQVSVAALTDTLIVMAVGMVMTRALGLAFRSARLPAAGSAVTSS
jgi:hypothetical protein